MSYGALGYFPAQSFWVDAAERSLLLESARETLAHLRATGEHRPIPPREVYAGAFAKSWRVCQPASGAASARLRRQPVGLREPRGKRAGDDPARGSGRSALSHGAGRGRRNRYRDFDSVSHETDPRRARVSIGRHGATLDCGTRQALLLPQVATGRDWGAEQFLSALSVKAGLGTKGYQSPGARLSVFQAQVFSQVGAQ